MEGGVSSAISCLHLRLLQSVYISTSCASPSFWLLSGLLQQHAARCYTRHTVCLIVSFYFRMLAELTQCLHLTTAHVRLTAARVWAVFSKRKVVQNKSLQSPLHLSKCYLAEQPMIVEWRRIMFSIEKYVGLVLLSSRWSRSSLPIVLSFNRAPYCFLSFP